MNMTTIFPTDNTDFTTRLTTYHVSASRHSHNTGAHVDRGANGGITGDDCHVIEQDPNGCYINIKGIDNHVMEQCPIVMAGGVANSNRGPIILIVHQFTLAGKGTSILSLPQMEWYSIEVDGKSIKVGGKQCLTMNDGFVVPLDM